MGKNIRVLLVEDSEDDAALLVRELHRAGYDITSDRVDTPERMNTLLDNEAWDLIFCDYSMPHFKGTDALALMKEKGLDIPFIFISGTMGEDVAVDAMRAGARDYIVKGNLKRLVPAVERELRETELRRQRNRMGEELRQSEEQFRLMTENIADLIAVLDLHGKRLYTSPSYEHILGNPEALRGTDSFQEIHPDDREKIKQSFRETVESGVGQRTEFRFLAKDGSTRYIESQGSVIKNNIGKTEKVVVVSRDVTEKKKLEQQFLRTQRMETIGTLAGGIAHDLNNVLAPIMMALEILRKRFSHRDAEPLLDTLEARARRGAGMIRQVLTFARGVQGERLVLQPKHLVEEMKKILNETFPKSIQIQSNVLRELWTISADPTQMHQVLLNLCVNARDAMPNGGRLKIEGNNVQLDEHYARMHADAKAGSYVVIKVSDTGFGIPPDILDKIFEPFYTTKEVGKGTGLGLSTVLAIVKSHGGFINVYSEQGKGTGFEVYLPAQLNPDTASSPDEKAALPLGKGEVILVIDDEASIREITKETLETFGYKVFTVGDGAEAVAFYVRNKDQIDAVLTDMMMPYMDGRATVRALQKIAPDLKIIGASGLASNGKNGETSVPGICAFLTKPYTAEKLLKTLHAVLNK